MSAVFTPKSSCLTPPPHPAVRLDPKPFRWTLSQYRELGKTGLFQGVKTMLIDGEIHTMPFPNPLHTYSLGMIEDWLKTIPLVGFHVRGQSAFDVGTKNDPGPDIAVVSGKRSDYLKQHPNTAAWIIEISESSLFFDTTTKAELYATAQVPEYWVLDLENRRLLVYRDPEPLPVGLGATAYRTHLTFGENEIVTSLLAPTSSVKVADLLP